MVCGLLALGGCDHYSNKLAAMNDTPSTQSIQLAYTQPNDVSQIEPAAGGAMAGEGKKFSQYLKGKYIQLAKFEQDQAHDYSTAKYYTDKIEKLQDGQMVMPASLKDFDIPADKQAEMSQARASLIEAMKTYRSPENRQLLASAQASFDCWMDQVEDQKSDNKQTCRGEFNESMSALVAQIDTFAGGTDMAFTVPLRNQTTVISEETRLSLARALTQWRKYEGQGFQMQLSPSRLSSVEEQSRQIAIVRRIMEYNDVSPSDIVTALASDSAFQLLITQPAQAAVRQNFVTQQPVVIQSSQQKPVIQQPASARRISYAVDY